MASVEQLIAERDSFNAQQEKKIIEQKKLDKKMKLPEIRKMIRMYDVTYAEIEKSLTPGKGYKVQKISTKKSSTKK